MVRDTLELRPLRYFLAVADAGQLTAAAAVLGLQQPPLSQQIQALERQLGMLLFERHPKGVRLTDAGRVLEVEARRLVDDADALRERMRGVAQGAQGRLRIAFTSSAAAHAFTPATLRACRHRLPGIELTIVGERNAAPVASANRLSPSLAVSGLMARDRPWWASWPAWVACALSAPRRWRRRRWWWRCRHHACRALAGQQGSIVRRPSWPSACVRRPSPGRRSSSTSPMALTATRAPP
jgi:DNA-binding transcriptional LysR family regulator